MSKTAVIAFLLPFLLVTPGALGGDEPAPMDLGPAAGEEPATEQDNSGETADKTGGDADEPQPFQGGRIEGTVRPASLVKRVRVVERSRGLSRVAAYDRGTGRFVADELPVGVWAVEVETAWGVVQGVDMRFRPAELDTAVPEKPADADAPKPPPLDDEDRAEITRHVTGPERFMTAQPLAFQGDGRRATVLVSLLRDRPFHGRKGDEIVWRLETWYYEDKWGHWERLGGTVVFRERVSSAAFNKRQRQFEPSLGGLEITPQTSAPVVVNYTVGPRRRSQGIVPGAPEAAPDPAPGDADAPTRPDTERATPEDEPKPLDERS